MNPTKYIPLVQKPECCAVTCLQMILYRRTGRLYDQQELAEFFDVKINQKHIPAFNVPLRVMRGYNKDEGISTIESIDRINTFFETESLSLRAESYRASQITDLTAFIKQALASDHDLWIEYHNNQIYPGDIVQFIHDSLIESYDPLTDTVILIDPEYKHPPRKTVSLDMLQDAMSTKFGKEAGIVVVRAVEAEVFH